MTKYVACMAVIVLLLTGCSRSAVVELSPQLPTVLHGEWVLVEHGEEQQWQRSGQLVIGVSQAALSITDLAVAVLKAEDFDVDAVTGAGSVRTQIGELLVMPGMAVPRFAGAPLGPSRVLQLQSMDGSKRIWKLWPVMTVAVAESVQAQSPTEPAVVSVSSPKAPVVESQASRAEPAAVVMSDNEVFLQAVRQVAPGLRRDAEWMVALHDRPLLVADAWAQLAKRRRYALLHVQLQARHTGDSRRSDNAWQQWTAFKKAYQDWARSL